MGVILAIYILLCFYFSSFGGIISPA